ncbi:hypothetical protein [Lentzea kentuckyensis]|uniref:hypothetical protein n=1 Tax=Lentzea kentuckyensis TaxID=360086 RepID=UPI001302DAD3|nr:hypothetical protein [Lentzea kentuckyensis]
MPDMTEDPAFKKLMESIDAMPPLTPEQREAIGDLLNRNVADAQAAVPVDGADERPADPA